MELRRLTLEDLDSCFANRLRGLANDPNAFLTTLDEERVRGNAHFTRVLSDQGPDNVIFGAVKGEQVIATVGIFKEPRPKLLHKATIWGMYVDIDYRGQGLAGKLLDMAVDHAKKKMKVVGVYLSVESTNSSAKKLYEGHGFRRWGTEPKAMSAGGTFFDEDHYVLEIVS